MPLTALALNLDQNWEIFRSLTIPFLERCEELETVTSGANSDINAGTISWRRLESVLARVVSTGRQLVTSGVAELELFAV